MRTTRVWNTGWRPLPSGIIVCWDSEQVAPGVVLDYDAQDTVLGVEMVHVSKRAGKADLHRLLFETLGGSKPEAMAVCETPPPYGQKAP